MGEHDSRAEETARREFIRRRPEQSPEQGAAAGPGAPETREPMQGERLPAVEREGTDA